MKTCDKCMKHDICGKREVFGAVGCVDDFQQKPQTNADKIRSMSDEELAEFLSENTNCDCCNIQCIDKLNCPSMSSCLFRFIEWLQSEVSE